MNPMTLRVLVAFLVLAVGSSPNLWAQAQSNPILFSQFQFNFSTPGARAAAMGRTFIGIADDASAAVSNPAGLINLTKPQVYFEYKNTELRSRRLAETESLTTAPFRATTFRDNIDALSFFNVSVPITDKVAVSFTRHEFLNQRENFTLKERTIPVREPLPFRLLFEGDEGRLDFKGASYAGSVAVALPDSLSLGVTVSANRLKVNSFDFGFATVFNPRGGKIIHEREEDTAKDTALGITVGALYQPPKLFSLGVFYSNIKTFKLRQRISFNPGFPVENRPLIADTTVGGALSFKVPDRFGVGTKFRPVSRLLLALDVVRIFYSQTGDKLPKGLEDLEKLFPKTVSRRDILIKDGTEIHFGGELNVGTEKVPVFLRTGVFTNPNHQQRFFGKTDLRQRIVDSQGQFLGRIFLDDILNAQFNIGDHTTKTGITLGAGISILKRLQADVAYVSIDNFDEIVASVAIRFK